MAKPQEEIDLIWAKYKNALSQLNEALDENEALQSELDLDFTMPADIAELEAKIEARLGTDA
jgi:hypothetical protein